MIDNLPQTYVRKILTERNMTQMDLIRKMKDMKIASDKTLNRSKLNNWLNGTSEGYYTWARRIEIALELPDYTLINMRGTPTEKEWEKIKEIGKNVD